jgi:hypothetical protein
VNSDSDEHDPPERPVDDWHLDEVDWFGDTAPTGFEPSPRTRRGLVPAAREVRRAPVDEGRASRARRRGIAAVGALGIVFASAIIVPLVVFDHGEGVAQQTTPLTGAAEAQTTTPTTTVKRPTTTSTNTQTGTSQEKPSSLRVTLPNGPLTRGDRGEDVKTLQRALAALGFAVGEPDGTFGRVTEAAVADFQRSNNLDPDGVVGADTARLLNTALARLGAASE